MKTFTQYYNEFLQANNYNRFNEWIEIDTKMLDKHNDSLIIFIKYEDNVFTISDDSYIIQDIVIDKDKDNIKEIREQISLYVSKYNIFLIDDEMLLTSEFENLLANVTNFCLAMSAINTCFSLDDLQEV